MKAGWWVAIGVAFVGLYWLSQQVDEDFLDQQLGAIARFSQIGVVIQPRGNERPGQRCEFNRSMQHRL